MKHNKLTTLMITFLTLISLTSATPSLSDPSPADNATGVPQNTDLSIYYTDSDGDSGTVEFYTDDGDLIDYQDNVANGSTVTVDYDLLYGEHVEWYVEASDGTNSTNTSVYDFYVVEKLFEDTDRVIDDSFTSQPFTADTVGNLTVDVSLDDGESLNVTFKGYNSTEQTGNWTKEISSSGIHEYDLSGFTSNTSTYTVEFEAQNGSVVLNDAVITGTTEDFSPSGAAPGSGGPLAPITGAFSNAVNGLMNAPSFVLNLLADIGLAIGGIFA